MKIYVDELPKSCKECPLYRSGRLVDEIFEEIQKIDQQIKSFKGEE